MSYSSLLQSVNSTTVILKRVLHDDKQTLGFMSVQSKYSNKLLHFSTLELPFLNNKKRVSCIPTGNYICTKYKSPSKGLVILFHDVPNRDFIEVHSGNFNYQIAGCVLVGYNFAFINDDRLLDVRHSGNALNLLLRNVPSRFLMIVL